MIKINKLSELCNGRKNNLNLVNYENYVKQESFQKFVIVIGEYHNKYRNIFNEKWKSMFMPQMAELSQDKKFREIFDVNFEETESFYTQLQIYLKNSINEMNIILKNSLKDQGDILRDDTEGSIVLLDYLVTYFQLTQLILDRL
jgi:serine/threonine-protein kinase ULK2